MIRSICAVLVVSLVLLNNSIRAEDRLSVVVSVKPVHSIISGLMEGIGEPTLLIGGKQTPYDFQLNKKQRQKMADASLFIWVGAELEQSLQADVATLPDSVTVIELLSSPDLKILPSRLSPNKRDPFFWMDDRNMLILLDHLSSLLITLDPIRSHVYHRNRLNMLKPLLKIDKEYEYGYRGLKAGVGVQYFDTLRYFEQAYALKTLGQVSASPRQQVDAVNLLKLRSTITNKEADCLFLDKGMSAEHVDLLTAGLTVNIAMLDTLGVDLEPGPNLYLQLMEYNTDAIKQCLNADMEAAAKARQDAGSDTTPVIDGVGGRFILTNQLGETITEQEMKGKYGLIFFGYTSCPDICPTNMMVLSRAISMMKERSNSLQGYFITVDPARDTVKVLRDYLNYFDNRLMALTGSEQMIERVAKQFGVKFEKMAGASSNPELYAMDHTSSLFLMAPDGSFVTRFAYGINADDLAKQLLGIMG
ncbi:MAG: zinc ABC transporter solute-binding protein [Gammaproteobacteria bacterium]|nr:zinc ABC transporter solute-binding protein [Gammaproteobacteria bacterium]